MKPITRSIPLPSSAAIKVLSAFEERLQRLLSVEITISVSSQQVEFINEAITYPVEDCCWSPSISTPAANTVMTLALTDAGSPEAPDCTTSTNVEITPTSFRLGQVRGLAAKLANTVHPYKRKSSDNSGEWCDSITWRLIAFRMTETPPLLTTANLQLSLPEAIVARARQPLRCKSIFC